MKPYRKFNKVTLKEAKQWQIDQIQHIIEQNEKEIEILTNRINYLESIIIDMKKNQVAIDLAKLIK